MASLAFKASVVLVLTKPCRGCSNPSRHQSLYRPGGNQVKWFCSSTQATPVWVSQCAASRLHRKSVEPNNWIIIDHSDTSAMGERLWSIRVALWVVMQYQYYGLIARHFFITWKMYQSLGWTLRSWCSQLFSGHADSFLSLCWRATRKMYISTITWQSKDTFRDHTW